MKNNIRITLEYDGSRYDGWQKQGNTDNTIQGKLENVLFRMSGEEIEVHGSGRTDAGVHARGQVANFHINAEICPDGEAAREYLNRYLPDDIRVLSAKIVPERFHSRLSATSKTYGYYVETGDKKNVFERKYVYGCGKKLDVKAMRQAAEFLIGEHDFKSFCANRRMKKSTVRRIDEIRIVEHGTKLEFLYTGNGFLYNMVRIIAGTLLEVGMGAYPPEHMEEILDARDRQAAGRTAPARGLTLVSMEYQKELPDWHHRENKYWEYDILQSHIKNEKNAYFVITRCVDEEMDGILRRNIHHAFQNGAERVYVTDLRQPERLRTDDVHGRYVFGNVQENVEIQFTREELEKLKRLAETADSQPKKILRWVTALPVVDNASEN